LAQCVGGQGGFVIHCWMFSCFTCVLFGVPFKWIYASY
jgi:hypothetical protein